MIVFKIIFIVISIIIIVIIGVARVTNYSIGGDKQQQIKVYELNQELNLEGESVANYGIFNDKDLDIVFSNFTKDYGEYINGGEEDIYFVYGNKDKVKIIGYTKQETGNFQLSAGGSTSIFKIDRVVRGKEEVYDINLKTDSVTGEIKKSNVLVEVGGKKYPFEIKRGQNFFFIIQQPTEK